MADVQFNEPQYAAAPRIQPKGSRLSRYVVQLGLAKDADGAQRVLLIIAVAAVLASVVLLFFTGPSEVPPEVLEAEVMRG